MVQFFGNDRRIRQITAGDVDEWAADMRKQEYAPATIATFIKRARQVFGHAVRKQLLSSNPFKEMKLPSQVNKAREEFVGLHTIAEVIEYCPDAEWRLIVALARYGGLRTPSETLALEWSHVDWGANRVTIHAPKQAHLANGGLRQIPLFPELRRYLEEAFQLAQDGSRFAITRYRSGDTNLRTQFQKIIRRAGVKPWGRLFHNFAVPGKRSSRSDFRPTSSPRGWAIRPGWRPNITCKCVIPTSSARQKARRQRCQIARRKQTKTLAKNRRTWKYPKKR